MNNNKYRPNVYQLSSSVGSITLIYSNTIEDKPCKCCIFADEACYNMDPKLKIKCDFIGLADTEEYYNEVYGISSKVRDVVMDVLKKTSTPNSDIFICYELNKSLRPGKGIDTSYSIEGCYPNSVSLYVSKLILKEYDYLYI